MGVFFLNRSQVVDWLHDKDGNTRISGCSENGHEEKNGSDEDVSIGLTPTSGAVHGANLCNLTMSQQSTIHWQRQHTDAGELLLHLSCFISALSLVACLDWNLIELLIVKQKVKKFQQKSFEERSTRSGKLESKILQLSEMLEVFLYCTYLRQASEQRLLAELARMCAEQSCKPQARATEKLDMVSLPLKDGESQTGMCCYQEWCVLLRNSALEWLLLCAYSIACHHMHAQQTRIACMARERSELEAKESLAQAQIAKLQQQLQELQFSYAAERSRSELLESKVCELELAVRNKDLQLAEFQSAEKEEFVQTQHELLEVTANVERAMPVLDKDESKGAALLQVKDGVPSLLHAVQDADHLAAERKAFQEELCGLREELKSLQEALKSATFFQKKQSEDNLDSAMLPETPTSGTKSPTFGKEFERPLRLSSASTTLPDRELGDDLEEQDASPEEVDSPSASAERLEETCRSDLASAAPLACGSSSSGFGGTTLTTFESMPPPICRPLCSSNASTRLPKDDLEEQGASSPEEASNVLCGWESLAAELGAQVSSYLDWEGLCAERATSRAKSSTKVFVGHLVQLVLSHGPEVLREISKAYYEDITDRDERRQYLDALAKNNFHLFAALRGFRCLWNVTPTRTSHWWKSNCRAFDHLLKYMAKQSRIARTRLHRFIFEQAILLFKASDDGAEQSGEHEILLETIRLTAVLQSAKHGKARAYDALAFYWHKKRNRLE